jgi:uncharacterized membrane protein YozB (DUF420 family)
MKLNSEHFILAIVFTALAILILGLAYKSQREALHDMDALTQQHRK